MPLAKDGHGVVADQIVKPRELTVQRGQRPKNARPALARVVALGWKATAVLIVTNPPRTRHPRIIQRVTVSLAPGTRLGPYEITGQIGAGGMGEVYRATDPNLGRQVAIKVLPDAIAHDPERVARFEREARTLATLNVS
jgi:serine/threonine protein kinase